MTIQNFALNLLQRNPNIANNPNAIEMINVIRSGDATRGAQIAQNICNSYGVSQQEATEKAKRFFGF